MKKTKKIQKKIKKINGTKISSDKAVSNVEKQKSIIGKLKAFFKG